MIMSAYADLKTIYADAKARWPENYLYCLADHAGMPGLLGELDSAKLSWVSLFEGSSERNALQVAPLLFALNEEANKQHSHFLRWLSEHGTYTSSMLLLSSPLNTADLQRRLTLRLNARVSGQMDVMLRYFDPRTFEGLLSVLTPHERADFLNVADCWWYFDRSGREVVWPASSESVERFSSPLVLSEAQEFGMLDASEPDQVAQQLTTMMPDHYRRIALPQRHAFLSRHMAEAKTAGIVSTNELVLYCGLALLYGEEFARQPAWQLVLERVRSGRIKFSDAVIEEERKQEHAV